MHLLKRSNNLFIYRKAYEMNQPVDRSEQAIAADLDEVTQAGVDEANELSKDDLSGVNGGVVDPEKYILPFVDQA